MASVRKAEARDPACHRSRWLFKWFQKDATWIWPPFSVQEETFAIVLAKPKEGGVLEYQFSSFLRGGGVYFLNGHQRPPPTFSNFLTDELYDDRLNLYKIGMNLPSKSTYTERCSEYIYIF